MTTRNDLFLRVKDAIDEVDLGTGIDLEPEVLSDVAYAAIDAIINTIGDHALAQMIGDTGERPQRVTTVSKPEPADDQLEILQDDEDDD